MDYRVEEIARAAGVGVDTVRFYQGRGLLPPPQKRGRVAIYGDAHLERVRRIRELNRQGLTLDAVRRVLEQDGRAELEQALLGALERAEGGRSYAPGELAAAAGVPEPFLEVMRRAALLEPVLVEGSARYSEADLRSARAARALLDAGLPLEELLPLAQQHAAHVRDLAQRAVELFDRSVRHADGRELPPEQVVERVQELLPAATALVALHFQRALIGQVRARLARGSEAAGALAPAEEPWR
jgi:DNA-binding transcriptional MerR regulator